MKKQRPNLLLRIVVSMIAFTFLGAHLQAQSKTVIVIAGDSTVADKTQNKDRAGWGWALEQWQTSDTTVRNTALGGRSSRSFRDEGHWDKAMAFKPDWVLIQFGHNDQKGKGPERESDPDTDYRDHLRRYVEEVRELGAKPILVSPVCRRYYRSNGQLGDSLKPYAEATRIVAKEMDVPFVDLHSHSYEAFSRLNNEESMDTFSPTNNPKDRTHFSTEGSKIVAFWVLDILKDEAPELAKHFEAPENVSQKANKLK